MPLIYLHKFKNLVPFHALVVRIIRSSNHRMNYDNFCPQSRLALNTELMLSGKMNSRRCAIVKADMAQFRRFYRFIFLKVKQAFQSLMIHSNAIICNNNLNIFPPAG